MIKTYFSARAKLISEALIEFLDQQDQNTTSFSYECIPFLKKMVVSGKLYRGSLVFLGYDLFSDKKSSNLDENDKDFQFLIKMAMVVELTQSAFLLHDDVMDQDDYRRGQQTFHKLIASEYLDDKLFKNTDRLGESLAICLGDLLIFWSNKLLIEAMLNLRNDKLAKKINDFYHHKMDSTAWGQMDDVYLATRKGLVDKENIYHVYALKSGDYSVVNPLLLGAFLSQDDERQLKLLGKIARNIGIIFQIKDDEMNLFGSSKETGKSTGSDIREDKKTVFRHELFTVANANERNQLLKIFGNKDISSADIQHVRKIMLSYNIQEKVNQSILQMKKETDQMTKELKLSASAKELFKSFVQLMIERKK